MYKGVEQAASKQACNIDLSRSVSTMPTFENKDCVTCGATGLAKNGGACSKCKGHGNIKTVKQTGEDKYAKAKAKQAKVSKKK